MLSSVHTSNLNRPPSLLQSPISSSLDKASASFSASRTSLNRIIHITWLRKLLISSSLCRGYTSSCPSMGYGSPFIFSVGASRYWIHINSRGGFGLSYIGFAQFQCLATLGGHSFGPVPISGKAKWVSKQAQRLDGMEIWKGQSLMQRRVSSELAANSDF